MKQMGISVVINTYNANKHLHEVINAVKDFDEVIVCDMESTDNTVEIAKTFNCKIITYPKGECTIVEPARNFAITQARQPWILVVDADEVVTPDLKKYLYQLTERPDCPSGIYIPRKNYFMGHFMHSYYPDPLLRFFKKENTVWPPTVHSTPIVEGKIERIPPKRMELALIHLANDSIEVIVRKFNDYTDNEVIRKKHKKYGVFALIHRPLVRFIKVYFIKGGFRDGKPGLIRAYFEAYYQVIMVSKMIEARQSKNSDQ